MKDTIEYSNGEITVFWQPARCRHAGICVKTLPEVYHPQEKPWIRPENATLHQLLILYIFILFSVCHKE